MLHLASQTRPDWLPQALGALPTILIDHAHCEKKAASTALSLLFKYPKNHAMLVPLSELAREELEHFEQVLGILQARGIAYDRIEPSPYAAALHKSVRGGEKQLLDVLLCCGLIEARSCERMKLLASGLTDPELATFYTSLLASEARHHMMYVDLAKLYYSADQVKQRLSELAQAEAAVLQTPGPHVRLHS
jgi:tRNA-(ms[2]io[6]A)-hydroxylase